MQTAALLLLVVLPLCGIVPGVRMTRAVPRTWARVRGRWLGPQLQFTPSRYAYAVDGRDYEGTTRVRHWRRPLGAMTVAVDPSDPSRSMPAATRTGGLVLIAMGALCFAVIAVLLLLGL